MTGITSDGVSASVGPVGDWAALERRWRALEAVAPPGFFRSWTWIGCDVARRFDRPLLVAVTAGGADLALGLLNRSHGRLFLNETGDPARDAVFTEHNGFLLRDGAGAAVITAGLRATLSAGPALVVSGTDAAHVDAARRVGWVRLRSARPSPVMRLGPGNRFSAGFRAELRRAERAAGGAIAVARAAAGADTEAAFDALVALHQRRWTARGERGAFADPAVVAFHRTLLAAAVPRGEAELLRVTAGARSLGLLYMFRERGRALYYQGGFDYTDDPRDKPGLLAHVHAAAMYGREGVSDYDLLAGDQPYKRRLAPEGGPTLAWITVVRRLSARGVFLAWRGSG